MSKKKPDYTKFMRKPVPLHMSSPSDLGPLRGPVREEEIPWAEIVEQCPPRPPEYPKPIQPPITVDDDGFSQAPSSRAHLKSVRRLAATVVAAALWRPSPLSAAGVPPLPALLVALALLLLITY